MKKICGKMLLGGENTYFQPTIRWQQLQKMSATVCFPVVIIRTS
jgi:hypothetical protein